MTTTVFTFIMSGLRPEHTYAFGPTDHHGKIVLDSLSDIETWLVENGVKFYRKSIFSMGSYTPSIEIGSHNNDNALLVLTRLRWF